MTDAHDEIPALTAEEIAQLRKLVPFAADIEEEAEYNRAKRLLFRHWRGAVLTAASLVGAGVLIWEHGRRTLQSLGKFLQGLG